MSQLAWGLLKLKTGNYGSWTNCSAPFPLRGRLSFWRRRREDHSRVARRLQLLIKVKKHTIALPRKCIDFYKIDTPTSSNQCIWENRTLEVVRCRAAHCETFYLLFSTHRSSPHSFFGTGLSFGIEFLEKDLSIVVIENYGSRNPSNFPWLSWTICPAPFPLGGRSPSGRCRREDRSRNPRRLQLLTKVKKTYNRVHRFLQN